MNILITFYGDDFTGTTATAEALTETGVPTIVFTEPPSISEITENHPGVKAIGVAGTSRTMSETEIAASLPPVFRSLMEFRAPIFLYKVCSTFDSSARIGNIGKAIELGREIFESEFVPVLPAAPRLGRYTAFGNHFAKAGADLVHRLDRHPSMANHPITPMNESDLRLHLGAQTSLKIGILDVLTMEYEEDYIHALMDQNDDSSAQIMIVDCLYESHMNKICSVFWARASQDKHLFMVGSQEVGFGFGEVWRRKGLIKQEQIPLKEFSSSNHDPLLVVSGSCAELNGEQIRDAIGSGFLGIEFQPVKLLDNETESEEIERVSKVILEALNSGRSVLVHTAMSNNDPRIESMQTRAGELDISKDKANEIIGDALAGIILHAVSQSKVKRMVIAGGDTSGRIQRKLGITALRVIQPIGIAGPLCGVFSDIDCIDGLEIAFKGGQIGSTDYFQKVKSLVIPPNQSIRS